MEIGDRALGASDRQGTPGTSDAEVEEQKLRPGYAPVKSQYVKRDVSVGDGSKSRADASSAPPPKKKRRGQNKQRPRVARVAYSEQLCPSLHLKSGKETCNFGDRCRYLHDVSRYLAAKPPDLGDHCYMFDTYGRCVFGLACRYGSSHIQDGKNVINDKVASISKVPRVVNVMDRDLQERLRKKQLKFPRTDVCLRRLVEKGEARSDCVRSPTATTTGVGTDSAGAELPASVSASPGQLLPNSTKTPPTDGASPGVPWNSQECHDVTPSTCPEDMQRNPGESVLSSERPTLLCLEENESIVMAPEHRIGCHLSEKRKVDFTGKLYLAPLTTVGNLPFRRLCKELGADITCSEMALSTNLLQGHKSEWALVKRHESEDIFGAQVCGSFPDTMMRCAEVINTYASVDFVDINVGCPIDLIFKKGAGCALMSRKGRFESIVRGMSQVLDVPLTVKLRTGVYDKNWNAHKLLPCLRDWGASLATIHGRSREQRYTRLADWEYISRCVEAASPMPVFGNGDVLSFEDYNRHVTETKVSGVMVARGALIKPWIFTEIKEQHHWDISSSERMELLRKFANYGLEHWGSDTQGVENTRRFLLEWLSFLHRYIPVGLLERLPQRINERPPYYYGRDDLETLMSSPNCNDWVSLSEMLLGPVPSNFTFLPKHKANAYS